MINYILFHQFKHHLLYVKAWMKDNVGNLSPESIHTIKTLGSSQLDMYFGVLTVDEILIQVSNYLLEAGVNNKEQYFEWIGNSFRLCTLSDGSLFTLRFIDHARFVHIHPARHVPNTIRIKANALKTIICYILLHYDEDSVSIEYLNKLRKQYLQLPPLSATAEMYEIDKVFQLLRQG